MSFKIKINQKQTILFFILFLIAFLPRIYRLEENFAWDQEQGVAFWTIKKIVVEKKLPLIGQHFLNQEAPVFRPPFFAYFAAIPLFLTKNNPLSLEFCLSLFGALSAILIFWITRKLFNQKAAFFSFLGYSFSSTVIGTDKNLVPPTMLILTFAILLPFFLNALSRSDNNKDFLIIGFLVGLMFSFHFSAIIVLLSIFSLFLIFKKEFKLNLKKILIFLFSIFIMISPVLFFNARHGFPMIEGFKKIIFGESFDLPINPLTRLNLALSALNTLNLSLSSINLNIYPAFFSLILWVLPAIFIVKLKKTNPQKAFFLLLLALLFLSSFFLYLVGNPYYQMTHYLLFLIPPFFIVWGKILELIFNTSFGKPALLSIFIIFIHHNGQNILNSTKNTYSQKLEVVNEILSQSSPAKVTSVKFIDEDYTPYDFLVYFRAPSYGLKYENINLLQAWMDIPPDFVVKRGEKGHPILKKIKQ